MRFFPIWAACLVPLAFGQPSKSLPGCDPHPEVQQKLADIPQWQKIRPITNQDLARKLEMLRDLAARHPREPEPQRHLTEYSRVWDREHFPAMRARYRKEATEKPDDPLALHLAGVAIHRTDTDESIRLFEQALAKAPEFPWPSLLLAEIFGWGKRVEKNKAAEYIASFFEKCPHSTNSLALSLVGRFGARDVQVKVTQALRQNLTRHTDSARLRLFETLWGLEFRTRPPEEHVVLRRQVADDVKRLESLNPKPDATWLALLKQGYKQSGASEEAVTAAENRILREFPRSLEAYLVTSQRWGEENQKPEDHGNAEAWKEYNKTYRTAVGQWRQQFSEVPDLEDRYFVAVSADESVSKEEGLVALETYLKFIEEQHPSSRNWASLTYLPAVQFLLDHRRLPSRALALAQTARSVIQEGWLVRWLENDNLPDDTESLFEHIRESVRQDIEDVTLKAAILLGKPEEVQAIRSSIEGPVPENRRQRSAYWHRRARLASLEGRKVDALTYYQSALRARVVPPKPYRGQIEDDLTEEAAALWKELGGTEAAWAVWSKPTGPRVVEGTVERWGKPDKELPTFELADLSGNLWRLQDLAGKSLLINLWATWCVPCVAELPKLQEMYELVKDRTDLEIITFNVDEDLGLVQPFMKERGYDFPVLVAYNFVEALLDDLSIPQNWIIDPEGRWRWTQLGSDVDDPKWVESMIRRLESVKGSEE